MRVPPLAQLAVAGLGTWASPEILAHIRGQGTGAIAAPLGTQGLVGIAVCLAGLAIILAGVRSFARAKTTVDPLHPDKAESLVTGGIYRVTRNPMYLGMVLILAGWTVWLGTLLGLIWMALFFLSMDRLQIPPEERALRAKFGETFDAYCRRTPRWLLFY